MKSFKAVVSLIAVAVFVAACALIPPIPIGRGALGYTEATFPVDMSPTGATAAVPLAASGSTGTPEPITFDDIEPPAFPVAPRSLRSLQGFRELVQVSSGTTGVPANFTLTSGAMSFTVANQSGGPEPVTASVEFGTLSLEREDSCAPLSTCDYTFEDSEAAARALTVTVRGSDFRRLLRIITEDGSNTLDVVLSVTTDAEPTRLTLTVEVEQNYIDF